MSRTLTITSGQLFGDLRFRRFATVKEAEAAGLKLVSPKERSYAPFGLFECVKHTPPKPSIRSIYPVTSGHVKSCGCARVAAARLATDASAAASFQDEAGKEYGTLVVLRRATEEEIG